MNIKLLWSKLLKKARSSSIKNSKIHSTSKVESGTEFYDSVMNRYSSCGYNCHIINTEIGAFTSIASNVIIGGATHPMSWVGMSPVFYKGRDSIRKKFVENELEQVERTIIGNDVWIGSNAIVKSGVRIGDGAVIGMGSVVTKSVGNYEIWAGNPAKLIKKRFDDDMIDELISIEWWNFDDDRLQYLSKWIASPEEFIIRSGKI